MHKEFGGWPDHPGGIFPEVNERDGSLPSRCRNPFAWDGQSPQVAPAPVQALPPPPDPQALADCLRQLPKDAIEAESAHDRRQLEPWGSSRLKP